MTSLSFGQSVKKLPRWKEAQAMRMILVDMAGDFVAGYVLGRLAYWHDDSKKGETRLRIKKNGELWVARGLDDWFLECRLTPSQMKRALRILERLGLIVTKIHKFNNECTTHIRIVEEVFFKLWCFHAENPPTMNTFRPRSQEGRVAIESKAARAKKSVLKLANSTFQNEQKGGFKTDKKADSLTTDMASVTSLDTSTIRARENFSAQNAVVVVEDFQSFESLPKTPIAFDEATAKGEVEQQLLEFAAAQKIVLAPETARAIVESWPAARLDPDALYDALTVNAEQFGLDELIQPGARRDLAREMVEREAARARWLLCVWPAFPQAHADYHAKSGSEHTLTACFIAAWNRKSKPPKSWLRRAIAQHDAAQRARAQVEQQAHVDARAREVELLRGSLSPAQLEQMKRLLHHRMEQERPGGSTGWWAPGAIRAWEAEILLDPARLELVLNAREADHEPQPQVWEAHSDDETALGQQLDLEIEVRPQLIDLNDGVRSEWEHDPRLVRLATEVLWNAEEGADVEADLAALEVTPAARDWVRAYVFERLDAARESAVWEPDATNRARLERFASVVFSELLEGRSLGWLDQEVDSFPGQPRERDWIRACLKRRIEERRAA